MSDPIYAFRTNYEVTLSGFAVNHTATHRVRLPEGSTDPEPGTPLSTILLETGAIGGGTSRAADDALGQWLTLWTALWGSEMVVVSSALVYYPFGVGSAFIYVSVPDFSDTATFPDLTGTFAGPSEPAQQHTLTMIDSRGRVSKVQAMEPAGAGSGIFGIDTAPAQWTDIVDYLTGTDAVIRGAGGSQFVGFKSLLYGQNESVWRKRFR